MDKIRDKIKRTLSMGSKEDPNLDQEYDDVDDATHRDLSREAEKAEADGHPQGRPGSFLNRMISSGNTRTEKQLAQEQQEREEAERLKQLSGENK